MRQWRRTGFSILSLALLFFAPSPARAETPTVDPRAFGFEIPKGKITPGKGRTALTRDEEGNAVVGKVYVEVGDAPIILLPDGRLVARKASEVTATTRPFEPAKKDALAKQLTNGPLKGFQTKQSANYVYLYNTSEGFAQVTAKILESMLPGLTIFAKAQKLTVRDPEVPLVVIMFRTEEQFQAYQRMPSGVVAYYDPVKNHVIMYEEAKIGNIKPELAIQQSISTIAHEGTHQILHNIGVQQRLSVWPMWISEGLAEYLAPTSTGRNLKWKGAGQVNDFRMFELEQFIKAKASEAPDGQMVEHTVMAGRLTSTGYATSWALTHFIAKTRSEKFAAYLREVSKLGPFEGIYVQQGMVRENRELFEKTIGTDFGGMETLLVNHLKRQPYNDPFAEFPHYVCTILYPNLKRNARDANVFHSPQLAARWQQETVEKQPAENQKGAQAKIFEFETRAQAENFARQFLKGG